MDGRPRFVAGAIGPTNKTLSLSPNVEDPGYREVSFDEVKDVYREQAAALMEGGSDFILIETVFDTLNCRAAIMAVKELEREVRELRRANEILKLASAFFAQAELDRRLKS